MSPFPDYGPPAILLLLVAGHALADYRMQLGVIGSGKNRLTECSGLRWFHVLTAHALIHAGVVTGLTGSAALGCAEFVIHWVTDLAKCEGLIGTKTDQLIHLGCKIAWWSIWLSLLRS